MPSVTYPVVPRHVAPPSTTEDLDYADLAIIDFAKLDSPEGPTQLAAEMHKALAEVGFFYVINHGYTQSQNDRIFDIADVPFASVSDEEKLPYLANIKEAGSYQGYKMREFWVLVSAILQMKGTLLKTFTL